MCLAVEFFIHRVSLKKILFQILDIDPQTREIIGLDLIEEHLAGNPEVLASEVNPASVNATGLLRFARKDGILSNK